MCTPGTEQARNFLRVVPEDPGALPPAIDLEFAGNCAARPEPASVAREVDAFMAAVEEPTGERAVLYVEGAWEERYPVKERTGRLLWIARLLQRPTDDWWIWQVGAHFEVDGVSTRVDLDVMRSG